MIAPSSRLPLPVIYLWRAIQKYFLDKGSFHAATLTFFTIFALVPLLSFLFGLAQGFGFESMLKSILKVLFEAHPTIYDNLLLFTQNLLAQTREDVIAGVGLVVLLWSIYKVIHVLDEAFHEIWQIPFQKRSFYRIQQFVALLLIAPVLLVILTSFIGVTLAKLQTHFDLNINLYWLPDLSIPKVLTFLLWSLGLSLSYWGLPAMRIRIFPALFSGVLTGGCFFLLQHFYVYFQSGLTQYGVVYGSFASVPLFMLWMYLNWVLYLFGAELTFILDHQIKSPWELHLEKLPFSLQRSIGLKIMGEIRKSYQSDLPQVTLKSLMQTLQLPKVLLRRALDHLLVADLIICNHEGQSSASYLPKRNIEKLDDNQIAALLEQVSPFGKCADWPVLM